MSAPGFPLPGGTVGGPAGHPAGDPSRRPRVPALSGRYAGRAGVIIERAVLIYSRAWGVLLSGIFEPLFYLLAVQIGFAALVGEVAGPDGRPMPYVAFVAPALLAASAMNGAVYETFSVFFKFRYDRLYDAMLATPIGPFDIALGEIGWTVLRSGFYAVVFFIVMAVMGLVQSVWAVLLLPVALLIAFAFAAVGMVCATLVRSSSQFDYIQLAVMPMFLFSTTFFPLSVYPEPLQYLVRLSPLYHGVELMRGLAVGVVDPTMAGHVAFLVGLAGIGVYGTSKRLGAMLLR